MPAPSFLRQLAALPNLRRAWLWSRTNSDRIYKRYTGDQLRSYALSGDDGLLRLRELLLAQAYTPTHAAKLYHPKSSGIQRPISILTTEDHIVYQATTNLIAERLYRRVSHRYNKQVFGHLYAGSASVFFYRDWRRSYRRYTDAMRRAHADGYKYTASFDLTACYDSIDHQVLCHFLRQLRFDEEFCAFLRNLLSTWTESSGGRKPLYHGHGIPQGPLPSGLLAEVVLQHFDDGHKRHHLRYMRYVDDIRLFGKTEDDLRRELVHLDLRSKEIGLFPQSSKIDIHRIVDIEDEFKSISQPRELSVFATAVSQLSIQKRLVELSPRHTVPDMTRFKYVLGGAKPQAALSQRLIRIVRNQPALFESVTNYFSRATNHSKGVTDALLRLLEELTLYPAVSAGILRALSKSLHPSGVARMQKFCRSRLGGKQATNDHELHAAAARSLIESDGATWAQTQFHCKWKRSWWVRGQVIRSIDPTFLAPVKYRKLLNDLVQDECADVALAAAERIVLDQIPIDTPRNQIHERAQLALRNSGRMGRVSRYECPVQIGIRAQLGLMAGSIPWRSMMPAATYKSLIQRVAIARAYRETDPTAWIAVVDTINDLILDSLFAHDRTIGGYQLGNIGGVLSATSKFAKAYPKLHAAVDMIHSLRLEADLVHPKTKTTKKPTRRIRYRELKRPQRALLAGYIELDQKW